MSSYYSEYKNTKVDWLESIPSDWIEGNLNRFGVFVAGSGFPNDEQGNASGDIPFFKVGDTNREGNEIYLTEADNYISYETASKLSARIAPANGIMFPKVGAALLGNKRRILRQDSIVDNNCMVYVPTDGLSKFWMYVLSIMDFGLLSNPGPVPSVNEGQLKRFQCVAPPVHDRQLIAQFIDKETIRIDALIKEKQRFIDLLKEKRQALISHFVTKGLDANVPMKDSGVEWLGKIPEHWSVSRLSYLATVNGRVGWKALKADEYVDEGFAFLSTPDIKGKQIDFENTNRITEERYLESPEIMLEVGDVLLAKDGSTLGITAYVEELPRAATVNSSIAVLKTFNNQLYSEYLYWFLLGQYMQNIIQRKKEGMGVPHLFQRDINKFTILLPDFGEQKKICEKLRSSVGRLDFLLDEVRGTIDLLREHRTALISAAVTGKIDVRGIVDTKGGAA